MIEKPLQVPPWRILQVKYCEHLFDLEKNHMNPIELKNLFIEHVQSHANSTCIYTDGSKTDNGVGYAYVWNDQCVAKRVQTFASNYSAELLAIFDSLTDVEKYSDDYIRVITDLCSCIQGINRYNNVNPIARMIQRLIAACGRQVMLCWVLSHVGVAMNEKADQAAQSITNGNIQPVLLLRSDLSAVSKGLLICHGAMSGKTQIIINCEKLNSQLSHWWDPVIESGTLS